MPRGLRRTEPAAPSFEWKSGLPQGTAHGTPITPPTQGEVGLVGGESTSSTPGHGPSTAIAQNYKDQASPPKRDSPPQHPGGPPFTLTK